MIKCKKWDCATLKVHELEIITYAKLVYLPKYIYPF